MTAEDAARSGAQGDADPTKKGDEKADAGPTGDKAKTPDVEQIVAARVAQKLKGYGDLDDLKRKAEAFDQSENAKKSEAERFADEKAAFERDKATWEQERRALRVRSATVSAAARLGFRDPADAHRLLDVERLQFDDTGEPVDLEGQLKALIEAKPYLAAGSTSPSFDGGVRASPPQKVDMNELLRKAVRG